MSTDLQVLIDSLSPKGQVLARRMIEVIADQESVDKPVRRKTKPARDERSETLSRIALQRFRRGLG